MSPILIVYSSRAGSTADIAELLAERLREHGHQVLVEPVAAHPSPPDGGLVVALSCVIGGGWTGEALAWLGAHADVLAGRTALGNVCLTAADPAKQAEALAYNDKAEGIVAPVATGSFAGRSVPSRLRWWERAWLRIVGRQAGEDHVEPAAVRAWADELHGLIGGLAE